jgi:hypothetical protein
MDSNKHVAYWTRYVLTLVIAILSFNSYTSAQDVDLSLTSNYNSLPQLESESIRNSNKLFLSLTLNDFSVQQYDVRLRLTIESNGVSITTSNLTNFNRFTLIPGVPIVITSRDLADYFDVSTLDFSGIDKTQFLEQGILPEGNYKLCFTAIDAQADGVNPLSNKDCDLLPVRYSDEPIIISKASDAIESQVLKWSPNIKESDEISYELYIYEFKGEDVDEATTYQLPKYRYSINSESVDLKPILEELDSEMLYSFFIKGKSKFGFDHFIKNNGYSEGLLFQNLQKSGGCDGVGEVVFEEIEGPNGSTLLYAYVEGCDPLSGGIESESGFVSTVPFSEGNGYQAYFYCANPEGGEPCEISGVYGDPDCIIGSACLTIGGCSGTLSINDNNSTGGIIDYSQWTVGTGSEGEFNVNGAANENHRIMGEDPWGNQTVIWEARPEAASGKDGGWNTDRIDIDNTKTYRLSVWVNRKVRGANGRFYLGARGYGAAAGIRNIANDKKTTNPYFFSSSSNSLGPEDEWILVVAHIYPHSHTGTTKSPESGRYTLIDGKIGNILAEYKWLPETTQSAHRSYLYYCSDPTVRQQWAYPRFDVVDGTEPSLEDLLYGPNCNCDEECTRVEISEEIDEEGQLILTPILPGDCDLNLGTGNEGDFLWSNGETTLSIVAAPGGNYNFNATCSDGCCYKGFYFIRGNCWPGQWCSDGDACTINDRLNRDCDCIGEPIEDCDPSDPDGPTSGCAGDLSINVTVDPGGGRYLSADISNITCDDIIEYVWNNDYNINTEYYYSAIEEDITLLVVCASGCTYEAELNLGCTQGEPCNDDGDLTTLEYYDENCECITVDCPDVDGDGAPDDCDENQPCYGSIDVIYNEEQQILSVDISEVGCPVNLTYLWSNGATTASIPYVNPSSSYSITVTCATGCQYIKTKAESGTGCTVGNSCPPSDCASQAFLDNNCNCIDVVPEYTFTTNYEVPGNNYEAGLGQVTVTIEVDKEGCENPQFVWNTGQEGPAIVITNLEATYVVTVTCDDDCPFTVFYNLDAQDCVIGAPCTDGDACTIFDTYNADCTCIGIEIVEGDCHEGSCVSGEICDDGNPCTYFDIAYADYCCIGFYLIDENGEVVTDCGDDNPCIIDAPCNDGNPCTTNDIYNEICQCIGQPILDINNNPINNCEEDGCVQEAEIIVSPTSQYNEVILTANLSSCDSDVTYLWNNESTTKSIVVTSQTGTYSVIISCGDCTYSAYYTTNGCLVGLPCNDGLDCTENDEVQENCECHGTPIEDLEITFSTDPVYEESCPQEVCLPDLNLSNNFYFQEFIVELPSGELFKLNKGLNSEGFDFPYCLTYSGNFFPTPIAACDDLPSMAQLISDINTWLDGNGIASTVTEDPSSITVGEEVGCTYSIQISESSITFISYSGYTDLIPEAVYDFSISGICGQGDMIGLNVTASHDCPQIGIDSDETNTIIWSNGDQGESTYISTTNQNICLEVSITCANGCTYTSEYGNSCEGCIYGAFGTPCDDGNDCTINDAVTIDCGCEGQPLADSDYDGVCDLDDICPLGDDNIDLDGDGIPDACDTDVDCPAGLGLTIEESILTEPFTYCTFLNDPIFNTPSLDDDMNPVEGQEYLAEKLWLDAFVYIGALGTITIDKNTAPDDLNFPYEIEKGTATLLPAKFFVDMESWLGNDMTFGASPSGADDVSACVPMIESIDGEGNIIFTPDPIPGVLIHVTAVSPIIPSSLQFSWGEEEEEEENNNTFTKSFSYFGDENNQYPITLTAATDVECGDNLTYAWSTGETTASINIASPVGQYIVTVTCGICVDTETYGDGACIVGEPCSITDACDTEHPGTFDPYCICNTFDDIILEDLDGDGIPDACDDEICDPEFIQSGSDDEQICCNEPPALVYSEDMVTKEANSYCVTIPESIITKLIFELDNGTSITLDESLNYDPGDVTSNYFFHFPYCTMDNCDFYGDDLNDLDDPDGQYNDLPYNLKNITSLAYDLAKWAAFHGYDIKPSTIRNETSCSNCDANNGEYNLFIDEVDPVFQTNGNTQIGISDIYLVTEIENGDLSILFRSCDVDLKAGYLVTFDEYDGDCNITHVEVKHYNNGVLDEISDSGDNLDLSAYKFGPVPHQGVGFRATITCESGCIYTIETPDADCIVGEECVFPNPCADISVMAYDDYDCTCIHIGDNLDDDLDGVCNDKDQCPGEDDNLDTDGDGIPDCLDTECNIALCSYVAELPFGNCADRTFCKELINIVVRLPNDDEIKLIAEPYFNFPYSLAAHPTCNTEGENQLVGDLKAWFYLNEYRFGEITVENGVISITNTEIVFVGLENECGDKIEFGETCLERCDYQTSIRSDFNVSDCFILFDFILLEDGNKVLLTEKFPNELNFPYCIDRNFNPCNNSCSSLDELEKELSFVLDCEVVLDITINGSDLSILIKIIDSPILFTHAVSNENPEHHITSICIIGCDDGWACTVNDQYDENCNCIGTFLDSDDDGVCDAEDLCDGFPDYLDINNNNIPDCQENEVTIPCDPSDIPYCKYLDNILQPDNIGKVQMNNLIEIQLFLKSRFDNLDNPLHYLPYPLLQAQLEINQDCDSDGIVDILDPCPCVKAIEIGEDGDPHLWGTHSDIDCILSSCDSNNHCKKNDPINCDINYTEDYQKERAWLLNTFLFTVIDGSHSYAYEESILGVTFNTEVIITSTCATDNAFLAANNLNLDIGDTNDNGYIYDKKSKCYVYFDIDCEGNCLVNYAKDQSGNNACEDVEIVGDICTTDLSNTQLVELETGETEIVSNPGYFYIQCPNLTDYPDADICDLWEIVANPLYDPANPNGEDPCKCQQQMNANGTPATAQDSDGDGVCDILDQCAPAVDEDGNPILNPTQAGYVSFWDDLNGNGIPDCQEGCAENLTQYTKEGYSIPTGPGDVCDDMNPCTYDDVITAACMCEGVYIDTDDDGVYDCEDCGIDLLVDENGNPILDEDDNPILDEDGNPVVGCIPCNTNAYSVNVDAVGNIATAETPPGEIRTLVGCDVCPGIPDGDPLDVGGQYEGDLPMDYNDNGLPDCIDPPFKPICPDDFKIAEDGLGLILVFYTDDLSEEDYPEPISFQGLTVSSSSLVAMDYLTVSFGREVNAQIEIDNELVDQIITEVYYPIEYLQYDEGDFDNINIVYSDHQSCNIGGDDDVVPLPCPSLVSIGNGIVLFEQSSLGNIDLQDLIGTYTLTSGGTTVDIVASSDIDFDINNAFIKLLIDIELLSDFVDDFNGTITLPSGQICTIENGEAETCNFVVSESETITVSPGTPCDDLNDCTFGDIYVKDVDNNCICVGELKPDTDEDGLCDAIDPCPEDPNELDVNGDPIFDSCPCSPLELDLNLESNPEMTEGNDFYLYLINDMSEYENVTITIDDGQNDEVTQTIGASSPIIVSNLTGGYVYTITITANCNNSDPESLTYEVDAPFGDAPILCGKSLEPIDVSHFSLLPSLANGEEFQASDFDVNVKQVTGGYGKYSGKGYISVPFFNLARLNVVFKDITINTDRQMIDGFLEIKGYGLAILGDEISDAINSNLDGIISVLTDLSDVLTTLIDILEDAEKLIDETGHLVDPQIVKCVEDNTALLKDLKAQAEVEPTLPDDELAAIKLQIEQVSSELKDCLDQYNAELESILNGILTFIPSAIGFISSDCSVNGSIISNEYTSIKSNSVTAFSENVTNALAQFLPVDQNVFNNPSMVNTNSFTKVVSADQGNNGEDSDIEEVISYFQKQGKFDLCIAMPILNLHFQNNDMTLDQVTSLLKLFTQFGADLSSIIGLDLKEGVLTHEQIFEKYQEEIEESFISVLANFTY